MKDEELLQASLEYCRIEKGSIEEAMLNRNTRSDFSKDIILSRYFYTRTKSPSLGLLPDDFDELDLESKRPTIDQSSDIEEIEKQLQKRVPDLVTSQPSPLPDKSQQLVIDYYGFIISSGMQEESHSIKEEYIPIDKCSKIIREWDLLSEERRKRVKQSLRGGIPNPIRREMWKKLLNFHENLPSAEQSLQELSRSTNPYSQQVTNDLAQIFPNHICFCDESSTRRSYLKHVLMATLSKHSEISYSQSLAELTAVLLMHLNEVETFAALQILLEDYGMKEMFIPGFPMLYKCFFIHDQLLEYLLPRVSMHFRNLDIQSSMYAFSWFKSFYFGALPFPLAMTALDVILCEGMAGFITVSLALIKLAAEELEISDFRNILLILSEVGFHCSGKDFVNAIEECSVVARRYEKSEKEYDYRRGVR